MSCNQTGKFRYFYTGNQVGYLNHVGEFNFVSGGPAGSGISSGTIVPKFFAFDPDRYMWLGDAQLDQETLDASFPFINLRWIADIEINSTTTIRVSNQNIYVEDNEGNPRFYEARCRKAPTINITVGEWLTPNFEIGDMKFTLNNRDGFFNKYLAQGAEYVQWIGNKVSVRIGFGEKLSNYHHIFEGFVSRKQGLVTSGEDVTVKCYDKFDKDEVPLPPTAYDETTYPSVDVNAKGRPVPLIYGDWTVEVGDYGEIPATCINAIDSLSSTMIFQIAVNSLRSIGNLYLHRGSRKEGDEGPIQFLDSAVIKQPENGRFLIDTQVPSLAENYAIIKQKKAGAGSSINSLTSPSFDVDFVTLGVRIGDIVYREGVNTPAIVAGVSSGQLTLTGGITFTENDTFSVLTDRYTFKSGDRISVFCLGKDITTISAFRLADVNIIDLVPTGLSATLRQSIWTADNVSKKLYEISNDGVLIREIDFSVIDPSITEITGITEQFDKSLWIMDLPTSTVYRVNIDNSVGIKFSTLDIIGLNTYLNSSFGLTIDAGNVLTFVDNFTGNFYRVNPFSALGPTVLNTFNRNIFDSLAIDISDLSIDVNKNELCVVDRSTLKFYRINPSNGTLISGSDFLLSKVDEGFDFPIGVSSAQDGTIFVLNRTNGTVYNYNEFPNANDNAGFIARDLLHKYSGRTSFDFHLKWNQTCRENLSAYKSRIYIDAKTNVITYINKYLQEYNTVIHNKFLKYSLFQIHFDNFRTDGDYIREGDIKLKTFKPKKEYNQYFNSAVTRYKKKYVSGKTIESDTYISPTGIELSGREIKKTLKHETIYLRDDIDKLMPLFVRLAAAEPEFIDVTLGFRFLFSQISDFYSINFFDQDCVSGQVKSGRRFNNIPCFVRKLYFDLDTLEVKMKLWSLGTTAFGDFVPDGIVAGGEFGDVILTNLGTPPYISPTGDIIQVGLNYIDIAQVDGEDAETRVNAFIGKAWRSGFKVDIINASDISLHQTLTIDTVIGDRLTFIENLIGTVTITTKNSAGFSSGGFFVRYSNYDFAIDSQKTKIAYYGPPNVGYATSTTQEIEEQRGGSHNFSDGRLPYILHPKDYTP